LDEDDVRAPIPAQQGRLIGGDDDPYMGPQLSEPMRRRLEVMQQEMLAAMRAASASRLGSGTDAGTPAWYYVATQSINGL